MNLLTKDKKDIKELRKFSIIISIFFPLIFGLILPLLFKKPFPLWPHYIYPPVLLISLIYPPLLSFIYIPWMKLGHILGAINSKIILGLVFYLMFTPIAIYRKLTGKDTLELKLLNIPSYRNIPDQNTSHDMARPF